MDISGAQRDESSSVDYKGNNSNENQDAENPEKLASVSKTACIELLKLGYIKGFEELFLMSHESASAHLANTSGTTTQKAGFYVEKPILPNSPAERQRFLDALDEDGLTKRRLYSPSELTQIQQLWNSIEESECKAIPRNLYFSYRDLAIYLQGLKNFNEAVRFFSAAQRISENLDIQRDKIEAQILLGTALSFSGNINGSLKHYEEGRRLAQLGKLKSEEVEASRKLIEARISVSQKMDENDLFQEAIHHYMETLKVIQESCPDDNDSINRVHFQLGLVYQHFGDLNTAIKYIESYLQYCKELNNVNLTGEAQSAIAACYEKLGNHQAAIEHLETFAKLATDQNDVASLHKAYRQLGTMYNKLRNYSMSLKYYQKYYDLMMQTENDIQKLVQARCELGIAFAQANMSKYLTVVSTATEQSESLQKLLQWKSSQVI